MVTPAPNRTSWFRNRATWWLTFAYVVATAALLVAHLHALAGSNAAERALGPWLDILFIVLSAAFVVVILISYRARVKREIRERLFMQALIDTLPDRIFFKDLNHRFLLVNRATAARLGYDDPVQLRGLTDHDVFPADAADRAATQETEIARTGIVLPDVETRATLPDGGEEWRVTTRLPLRDETGAIIGTCGFSRDITAYKEAEASLHRLVDGTQYVLHMTDELLACNTLDDLYRRAVELPRERLGIIRAGLAFVTPDGRHMQGTYGTAIDGTTTDERSRSEPLAGHSLRALERAEQEGMPWTATEGPIRNWEGETVHDVGYGWKVVTPVVAGGTRFAIFTNDAGLTGQQMDETRQDLLALYMNTLGAIIYRRRAEEAQRESEVRLRRITDNMLDMIGQVEPDGRLSYVSPSAKSVLGYEPSDLLGTRVLALLHPQDRLAQRDLDMTRPDVGPVRFQARIRHADGHYLWMETVANPLRDEAGVSHGIILAVRDVTERKEAEEELARSNAELEQLAYVASHDLQEPLRMVASYVQLLARRYKGKLDADADDFIAYAVDGAGRMKDLINDLLAYSRVGTRRNELAPTPMGAVLERALQMMQLTIAGTGATVTADPLPAVMGDATQLGQVLGNLISNAIKFRGSAPPRVHISATREGGFWRFSVRDNGIGIEAKYFDRIFVMFQRLHSHDEYKGTGIGLAVCKRIIERHGGRIWVESNPGEGAVFSFTLKAVGGT